MLFDSTYIGFIGVLHLTYLEDLHVPIWTSLPRVEPHSFGYVVAYVCI